MLFHARLFCVTGGFCAMGIKEGLGVLVTLPSAEWMGGIPYVRLQLDILISKVFSYHLLNH